VPYRSVNQAAGEVPKTFRKRTNQEMSAFLEPTNLTRISAENSAYRQECFRPVALVFPGKDEAVAVAVTKESRFGRGGSLYKSDIERGKRVATRMGRGVVVFK
jgi:succinate-semialdehyde dehydrogenase/glutarate-semialdehyde dehydrogenase